MLKFGTSGLRALVKDMTDQECYINTRGFLQYLQQAGQISKNSKVSIAGDLRASTDHIMQAVGKAVIDAGNEVENCGKIPSPAVMYHAMQRKQASIMVTGSHIPDDRNGIKFNKPSGEVLKTDEKEILAAIGNIRQEKLELLFDSQGMFQPEISRDLPAKVTAAEELYIKRYLDIWPADALQGKKIVVDQHSAVGRDIIVRILTGLGAEVVLVNRSEVFIPKDTENVTATALSEYQVLIREHQPFALVTTDGDSDRPLVIDEKGEFHSGDVLGAVVALQLEIKSMALPISANDAVFSFFENAGLEIQPTRIGSPYVVAAMQQAVQAGKNPVAGWEVNGGFLLASDLKINNKILPALPTRDAMLPIIALLLSAVSKKSVSQVFQVLPQRFTQAGLLDNVPVEVGQGLLQHFRPIRPDVRQINYQANMAELFFEESKPTTEQKITSAISEDTERIFVIKHELEEKYFHAQAGFSSVQSINLRDGLRISFSNQDVVHIRPSGNAPQLRVYATANTQTRADEIVAQALAADGFLFKMKDDLI